MNIKFIDEILKEWSHKIENGKPNPTNCYHVSLLSQVLHEMSLPTDFIGEFIGNLNIEQGNICEVSYESEQTGSRHGGFFRPHFDGDGDAGDGVGDGGAGIAGGAGGGAGMGDDEKDKKDDDDEEKEIEK